MKRPADTGLFFGFGDGRSTTTAFIIVFGLSRAQVTETQTVVQDARE